MLKFRSSFKLNEEDALYVKKVGLTKIEKHALDFITTRLAPAKPKNDGKQTPFRGHPVFKAQHATATCCRGCLFKWHKIPKSKHLERHEIDLVKDIIMGWISEQIKQVQDRVGKWEKV
ncbi:MAG: DUF4186 domain-containing protein [Candidatus Omnitrophota bacterium]